MNVIRLLALAVMCAAISAPVSADVTLRLKLIERECDGRVTDVTEYRKGLKMRTDSSGSAIASVSTILDAGTGRVVMLWHDGKAAEVFDLRQGSASLRKGGIPEVKQSITPTVRSRQIAGYTCTVYDYKASFRYPEMERDGAVLIVIEGSMCLVKNGPGQADFAALYRAQGALDPMSEIQRQIPELGVPFATEQTVRMGGDEMTREVASQTTEVISVSTAPIPDSIFEIPADYQVTKKQGPAQDPRQSQNCGCRTSPQLVPSAS